MKKQISIEIEACDFCQEKEAGKYYHGGHVTCRWCGRVLCSNCSSSFVQYIICPVCKKELLSKYDEICEELTVLKNKQDTLQVKKEVEERRILALRTDEV